jgi:antitoxin ParD1/3/4
MVAIFATIVARRQVDGDSRKSQCGAFRGTAGHGQERGGGQYGSASEVIREALREWRLRQPLREAEAQRLRKAWTEGLESGPFAPFDIEDIKLKAHSRFSDAAKKTQRRG